MVLKPSEVTPLSAIILAEIMDAARVPARCVQPGQRRRGRGGRSRLREHPDIDLVSITGSTRAGVLVAKAAAESVKRVTQELGGKSANIILKDARPRGLLSPMVYRSALPTAGSPALRQAACSCTRASTPRRSR